ncbi:MAG: helix-turn-helix domain-containing protein [Labilithrix sp.]|nr:helix-turn-helix domain-containing protein [Labilithrix sp.]
MPTSSNPTEPASVGRLLSSDASVKFYDLLFAIRDLRDERDVPYTTKEGHARVARLTPTLRHVLVAIALFRDKKTAVCAPSIPQIEEVTGLGRSTIIRVVEELHKMGYLARRPRGRHASTVYELNVPRSSRSKTAEDETSRSETSQVETSRSETSSSEAQESRSETREVSQRALLRISPEDLPEDPSGGTSSSAALASAMRSSERAPAPLVLVPPPAKVNEHGLVIAAFREAYAARYRVKPDTSQPRTGRAAKLLLETVDGDVEKAITIVRTGVDAGERELHYIVADVNKYRVPRQARTSGRGGQDGLAVACESF